MDVAEALACREGLKLARDMKWSKLQSGHLRFECRSIPTSPDRRFLLPDAENSPAKAKPPSSRAGHGLSSLILKFPPNFVRQPSIKARRNRSNIGRGSGGGGRGRQTKARERLGGGIVTDAITTPVVNTSAYFFKKTADLIDFKEKRRASFEYGRYGNYTTIVAEEKISTVMLMALVPAGGHLVTTTDCYRKTRIFIETILPKMGITATVIDPADIGGLETALEKNNVALFFTESPTNPFLRCVDIELVSKLCHDKGALVCIDGTFATPLNQKALALGADIILHSATKYIGGHNDVLAGSISGPEKLISSVRTLHHILGGALNPNAAYLIIRGMKTLHLRIQQQNSTAQRMAEILEAHPKIRHVYYPGLASHPEHDLAKRQMNGFGGVVSFEVDGDLLTTAKFIDALRIPYIAPSFGGCESIVDQPAIMSYWDLSQSERAKYGIMDNLVRFSFGVEDFEDLKTDVLQALEAI
ncbi:hypothetical protein DH2020_012233 [Rehmannia glutinosa]|uniref:Cystathionine gamma-synthase n=1 Tax=Rehmannia glutinosa TaxID=99300 RepID=A0ABR0X1W8_REHGL